VESESERVESESERVESDSSDSVNSDNKVSSDSVNSANESGALHDNFEEKSPDSEEKFPDSEVDFPDFEEQPPNPEGETEQNLEQQKYLHAVSPNVTDNNIDKFNNPLQTDILSKCSFKFPSQTVTRGAHTEKLKRGEYGTQTGVVRTKDIYVCPLCGIEKSTRQRLLSHIRAKYSCLANPRNQPGIYHPRLVSGPVPEHLVDGDLRNPSPGPMPQPSNQAAKPKATGRRKKGNVGRQLSAEEKELIVQTWEEKRVEHLAAKFTRQRGRVVIY
jgi:hypothetical protein